MITVNDVTFKYKDIEALTSVSFELNSGVVGLLGENGAGKSTLMKMLSTLLPLQEGTITISEMAFEPKNHKAIRNMIGYMPQEFDFYASFTVFEVLEYLAILNKIDKSVYLKRIDEILESLNLSEKRTVKTKSLSGGMKRRLGLACAILNEPPVLIVDEPTVGLDPNERIRMRNFLRAYAKNRLVLLSTHLTEDIQSICSEVLILSKGRLLFNERIDQLIKQSPPTYQITCDEVEVERFREYGSVTNLNFEGNKYRLRVTSNHEIFKQRACVETTLEDAYMHLMFLHS